MAPLFYGALALLLDFLNLIVPTPNLVPAVGKALGNALSSPQSMSTAGRLAFLGVAAVPGLVWMAFVLNALRRVLRMCMSFSAGEIGARAPDKTVLAEQRFANVTEEMANAAALPGPNVFVVDAATMDAVAFGVDRNHASVVISSGLLANLNRAQMEGVAADLVASIANGDMRIGVRAALSVSLFSLIARLGSLVTKPGARKNVAQLVRATLVPTTRAARKLVMELASPLADEERARTRSTGAADRWEKIRPYLWLPLGGPLVITGFFGALVNLFVLGPLLALAWRQRKYMADATAVRLTRDPDTLAGALQQMSAQQGNPLAPWAAHMSVTTSGVRQRGMFGSSAVPMLPSIDRRLRALASMGAHVTHTTHRMPVRLWFIVVPLLTLLAVLVAILLPMLIYLSLMMTALFTGVPFAVVHVLLRWLGHH